MKFVAVDFDGTLCENAFPNIGEIKPNNKAIHELIKNYQKNGYKIILWTCRTDNFERKYLSEAIEWCEQHDIIFDYINENPECPWGDNTRKLYANIYIDDRSVNPEMFDHKTKVMQATSVEAQEFQTRFSHMLTFSTNNNRRIDKDNYYLNIAQTVLQRGTCLRRNYGAVIVKNDEIISTGYTGSPRGDVNCIDTGNCIREELKVPHGEKYELCNSAHAEMNAIISASRKDMIGATLYLVGVDNDKEIIRDAEPCKLCKRMIINAGIEKVIVRETENRFRTIKY